MYLCKMKPMFKKIALLYFCICAGSFLLAFVILTIDFGKERLEYGTLFADYQKTIYSGIGILCLFLIPIFMNCWKSVRQNKLLRMLSFFLWPALIFIIETSQSSSQEIKNSAVIYFSVFVCLLLGFIYFQRMLKTKKILK